MVTGSIPVRPTILVACSTKGGVGKTSVIVNLGGYLADRGLKVLAVDADIQPTLSSYYEITHKARHGLFHLITEADTEDVVSSTNISGLDIIRSDDPNGTLPNFILQAPDGRHRLKYTLARLKPHYDVVLIDTQGGFGPLQEAALFAGDLIVSPLRPDRGSAQEFQRGTLRVVSRARLAGQNRGLPVGPLAGLLYGIKRTNDSRAYVQALTGLLATRPDIRLLSTRVPDAAAYNTAATLRLPVHRIDRRRCRATPCAADVMAALAQEILPSLPS